MISNGTEMKVRWAKKEELSGFMKDFCTMFSCKSHLLIKNVQTTFRVLRINEHLFFPVTINIAERNNSFVCSPYTAYADYSKDEIKRKIKSRTVRFILLALLSVIARWLRSGALDKNVHINNFLVSTNPYPADWNGAEITQITTFIKSEYPDHAIIFRSINEYEHSELIRLFNKNGYHGIGSRQVYIFDLSKQQWLRHRNNKHDTKLISKSGLRLIKHDEMKTFLSQALTLYQKLYLEKYSEFNPQLTLRYFQECHEKKLIKFQGYVDTKGSLKAFSGQFTVDRTITSPLVGYDIEAPKKDGLYIHAAQLAIRTKFQTGLLLNLSSGASDFKQMRGGQPSIEYSMIYTKHLSSSRQLRWKVLKFISNKVGIPLLKKYKL